MKPWALKGVCAALIRSANRRVGQAPTRAAISRGVNQAARRPQTGSMHHPDLRVEPLEFRFLR
jgi:hypothetical protein